MGPLLSKNKSIGEVRAGYEGNAKVDFSSFIEVAKLAEEHRKDRLVDLQEFKEMMKDNKTVVLDTRSKIMYFNKHIKGAQSLNFADFTQENLAKVIPSFDTRVLIYCNNNFSDDMLAFPSKERFAPMPPRWKQLTMALNVPTYINLFGYGYTNVYELKDLISAYGDIEMGGDSLLFR